jgi:hypothetical protein
MQVSNKRKLFFQALGLLFCILPPALATLEYFPIWSAKGGEAMVSGLTLILLFICALPLKRYISAYLKSPSAWVIWLSVYILLSLLSAVIDDVISISLVAFPSNLIGSLFFRIAKKEKKP